MAVCVHAVHVHYLMKSLMHSLLLAQRPLVPVLVQKWMLLILAFLRISGCVTEREKEETEGGGRTKIEDKTRSREKEYEALSENACG